MRQRKYQLSSVVESSVYTLVCLTKGYSRVKQCIIIKFHTKEDVKRNYQKFIKHKRENILRHNNLFIHVRPYPSLIRRYQKEQTPFFSKKNNSYILFKRKLLLMYELQRRKSRKGLFVLR